MLKILCIPHTTLVATAPRGPLVASWRHSYQLAVPSRQCVQAGLILASQTSVGGFGVYLGETPLESCVSQRVTAQRP